MLIQEETKSIVNSSEGYNVEFKDTIVNTFSRRDYCEQGTVTMIELYDDRVEISNPGVLLSFPRICEEMEEAGLSEPIFSTEKRLMRRGVRNLANRIPDISEFMECFYTI
jgi:ATP-dependent DNA helicase RecG